MPTFVMAVCVMAICVMPLLRYGCLLYGFLRYASFRDGHLQNRLVSIQLWIDAFMIWTILFQILIIPPYMYIGAQTLSFTQFNMDCKNIVLAFERFKVSKQNVNKDVSKDSLTSTKILLLKHFSLF